MYSNVEGLFDVEGVWGFVCGVFVGFAGFYQQTILFVMTKYFK